MADGKLQESNFLARPQSEAWRRAEAREGKDSVTLFAQSWASLNEIVVNYEKKKAAIMASATGQIKEVLDSSLAELAKIQTKLPNFEVLPSFTRASEFFSSEKEINKVLHASSKAGLDSNLQQLVALNTKKEIVELLVNDRNNLERELQHMEEWVKEKQRLNDESAEKIEALSAKKKVKASAEESLILARRTAHNDYVAQLAIANAQREKYFETDLPVLFANLEYVVKSLIQELNSTLSSASESRVSLYSKILQTSKTSQAVVTSSGPLLDDEKWLGDLEIPTDSRPTQLTYTPPPSDDLPCYMVAEGVRATLQARIGVVSEEIGRVASTIGEQTHALYGFEKKLLAYPDPSKAPLDQDRLEYFQTQINIRNIQTKMQGLHSELALLSSVNLKAALVAHCWVVYSFKRVTRCMLCGKILVGLLRQGVRCSLCGKAAHRTCVDACPGCNPEDHKLAPVRVAKDAKRGRRPKSFRRVSVAEEEEDWDDEEEEESIYADSFTRAVALFDYKPANSDELELKAGQIVTLKSHGEGVEWWCGAVGSREGVVPASYVRVFSGNPQNLVKTLFAYEGKEGDELSFPAEELITLVEPDMQGWSVGQYKGKTGSFPSNYINANFVLFE